MKVKVVAGNRGKYVLRWTDQHNRQRQRTVDVPATTPNRRKAYKLAEELESELSGQSPPNLLLTKSQRNREDRRRDNKEIDPHRAMKGDWQNYKKHFIDTHLSGLSKSYRTTMMPVLNRFEEFCNPNNVKEATASTIRLWIASMRKENLSDQTIKSYWRHLSAFLSIAVDDEIIDKIPRVRLPKSKPKIKGRPFVGEELERILQCVMISPVRRFENKSRIAATRPCAQQNRLTTILAGLFSWSKPSGLEPSQTVGAPVAEGRPAGSLAFGGF